MENSNNKVNIIDLILERTSKAFEQNDFKTVRVVNAENFFIDNDSSGIMSKEGFLTLVHSLDQTGLNHLKALLKELTKGSDVDCNICPNEDSDKKLHVWASVGRKKGRRNYKIYTAEKLTDLIEMYQDEEITCDLSLEGLYQEANR